MTDEEISGKAAVQGCEWPDGGAVKVGSCSACGAPLVLEWVVSTAVIPPHIMSAVFAARRLTPRERVVFHLLGFGYSNRSIARELGISERTVKRYVTSILSKLRLQSRLQAGLSALILSSASTSTSTDDNYWRTETIAALVAEDRSGAI